jgi:hypothetical protein
MSTTKRPSKFPPDSDRQKIPRIEVESEAQSQGLKSDHNAFGSRSASRNRKRRPETESTGAGPLTKKLRSSLPNPEDRAKLYMHFQADLDWPSFCELFNAISRRDESTIALALNDSPQWARLLMSIQASRDARCNGTLFLLEIRIVLSALANRHT